MYVNAELRFYLPMYYFHMRELSVSSLDDITRGCYACRYLRVPYIVQIPAAREGRIKLFLNSYYRIAATAQPDFDLLAVHTTGVIVS